MNKDNKENLAYGDILVVDDDIINLKFLAELLTLNGYRVRPVSDGERALQSVQENLPELILLDYNMPGMNGSKFVNISKMTLRQRIFRLFF